MTTTLAQAAPVTADPAPHLREDLLTPRFYTTEIAGALEKVIVNLSTWH